MATLNENIGSYITFNEPSPYLIPSKGGTYAFHLTYYGVTITNVEYIYDQSKDWLTITASTNYRTITCKFSQNFESSSRSLIIRVSYTTDDGEEGKILYMAVQGNQEQSPFTLSETAVTLNATGQSTNINITSTFDIGAIIVSTSDTWLTAVNNYNNTITISAPSNNTTETRYGTVTVKYNGYEQTIEITQAVDETVPNVTITTKEEHVGVNLEYFSYYYQSIKGGYISNVTSSESWIEVLNNGNVLNVMVHANDTSSERSGIVTYTIKSTEQTSYTATRQIEYIQTMYGNLYFNPNTLYFKSDGTPYTQTYSFIDTNGYDVDHFEWEDEDTPDWYTLNWSASKHVANVSSISENNTTSARTFTEHLMIALKLDDSTISRYATITIVQDKGEDFIEEPIWKDVYHTLDKETYGNYQYYRLVNKSNNEEIYRGKLFFINDSIDIKINDIARNYIDINKPSFSNLWINNNSYINLYFEISENGNDWIAEKTYNLYYNYSYEDLTDTEKYQGVISHNILDYVDSRQFFIQSFQDFYSTSYPNAVVNISLDENSYSSAAVNQAITFCGRASNIQDVTVIVKHSGTKAYEKTYNVINGCNSYCIYYMTANGGWSWMLFDGKCMKSVSITTNNYNRNANNSYSTDFQKIQYLKELQDKWVLTTKYLSDKQSLYMQELITSPCVFLHILDEDKIIAVNVTDTSVDVKNFKNQGKKKYLYTVNVENSQLKIRK